MDTNTVDDRRTIGRHGNIISAKKTEEETKGLLLGSLFSDWLYTHNRISQPKNSAWLPI